MRMGLGIVLIAVGAILAFAVRDVIEGVDLSMVGWICMGVGVLALILAVVTQAQATNTSRRQVIEHRDGPTE